MKFRKIVGADITSGGLEDGGHCQQDGGWLQEGGHLTDGGRAIMGVLYPIDGQ